MSDRHDVGCNAAVIPNVLVNGVSEAIERSPAQKIYFVNLMWQPGETINFSASQHVQAIHEHGGRALINCVVLNTGTIPSALKRKYARAHVKAVENDFENLARMGVKVIAGDLVGDATLVGNKVRHNSEAITEIVIDLASRSRAQQIRNQAIAGRRTQSR